MNIPSSSEIIECLNIHPLKVKNIYMFGSRVYGNIHENSDYDFLVVANSLNESLEHKIGNYNIHVHTPDKFRRDLFDFDMHNLECIYAPDFAILQQKVKYNDANFKIKPDGLIYRTMSESFNTFQKAKLKFEAGDVVMGKKKLYHSFRVLNFASQILKEGLIKNFSEVNDLWKNIQEDQNQDWQHYRETFLPKKISFEKMLQESVR
jgi:hypothetical protein